MGVNEVVPLVQSPRYIASTVAEIASLEHTDITTLCLGFYLIDTEIRKSKIDARTSIDIFVRLT